MYIRLNSPPPSSVFPAPPEPDGDDGRLEGVPSDRCKVGRAEEERILRVALELVFEDAPMPRREGNKG
jgi:hypothetical protein